MVKNKFNTFFYSKQLRIIIGFFIALSCAFLSLELMFVTHSSDINILYSNGPLLITMFVSFICSFILYLKTHENILKFCKNNVLYFIMLLFISLIVLRKFYVVEVSMFEQSWNLDGLLFNPHQIIFFSFSYLGLLYVFIFLFSIIKSWLKNFVNSLDKWDKKVYFIATIISTFIIIIAYSFNENWYLQYDKVYSMDSGWFFSNMLPYITYYTIRHPLISVFIFPVWAIVTVFVNHVLTGNLAITVGAIILQIINSQLLIIIGLLLKKITENKMVFIMYMISFPTILFTLFLEKYQLCVFLIVLYVFTLCVTKKKSEVSLISAASIMPTSSFIGVSELFTNEKFINKIKKIIKIIIFSILIFICLGRIYVFKFGFEEINNTREFFITEKYSVAQKVIATTTMIKNAFIALPSGIDIDGKYMWQDLKSSFSIVSLFIILIIILGAVVNRKMLFTKIAAIWFIFSFLLFVLLNWCPNESPLFTLYFSWALIPLFIFGIDYIIKKLNLNYNIVYMVVIFFMIIVNLTTIIDIIKFMISLE